MLNRLLIPLLLLLSLMICGAESRCGERLERALDLMQQRRNSARRRYDSDDADAVYHQRLHSAPIDVSITKLVVEIPGVSGSRDNLSWAKVERCAYEPSNNSIRTRVAFNELAVTGVVQLVAHEPRSITKDGKPAYPAEVCRMNLRVRRAGMEFYTSPIARGRGQMRIRTESSFLEPRFASIYAYGCRPVASPVAYDRIESSEPRNDARLARSLLGLVRVNSDSNLVSNSSVYEDEDAIEEENRLGSALDSYSNAGSINDALLDTLWRSRADIAREMEDMFLRSASQAITHYIEKQLHPAIKETLMLSMGYTISYG